MGRTRFLSADRDGAESGQKTVDTYSLGPRDCPQEAGKREEDETLEHLSWSGLQVAVTNAGSFVVA